MKKITKLLFGVCTALLVSAFPISAFAAETVTADGDLSEWTAVASQPSSDSNIAQWKVAKSEDGSVLYFCFSGVAVSQWDSSYLRKLFNVTYDNESSFNCQIANLTEYWIVPGAEVVYSCNASGTNPGLYSVECILPMTQSGYRINFAGESIQDEDIPVFIPSEEAEAVYEGIVIDGSFDDWKAVSLVEAECPAEANHAYDCLDYTACVFDGDYVYIYLQDGASGSAAGAGVASNGRYSITTDLGRQITFELRAENGGTVKGVTGATAAYFGNQWEIAIPASELPKYRETISFGLYQSEPFVTGIMNLQGNEGDTGNTGDFTGIVYDGLFGDWSSYPHTLIQYATSGTQTNNPDGEGALYVDGSTLYGHVVSSMAAHLAEMGGEFARAVSICFNGDRDYNGDKTWNLYPRFVAVAADGTIDWNPQTKELPNGTYEFYIADMRGEYNTSRITNINDLDDYEQFFGKLSVTIYDTNDEIEFYIDLEKVAEFLSHYSGTDIEASDFKLIEAQFGRIGQEWLVIGGTSSGPYMGVGMCMAVVAIVLLRRRRNKVVG